MISIEGANRIVKNSICISDTESWSTISIGQCAFVEELQVSCSSTGMIRLTPTWNQQLLYSRRHEDNAYLAQPVITTVVPPPMKAEPSSAGATLAVVITPTVVSSSEMSFARVVAAYEGWFTICEMAWVVPPVILWMTPKTTIVLDPERPIVQCASSKKKKKVTNIFLSCWPNGRWPNEPVPAESTQFDEIKAPPENIVDKTFFKNILPIGCMFKFIYRRSGHFRLFSTMPGIEIGQGWLLRPRRFCSIGIQQLRG